MTRFITIVLFCTILCAQSFAQTPLPTGTGGEVLQIGPTIINPIIKGGVASDGGTSLGITPQVTTNAALQGACTGFAVASCPTGRAVYSSGVWRVGINTQGDAPPLFWKPQNSACSQQFGDIGSCVVAADGTSFVSVPPADGLDLREFGVKFDGTTDNSTFLQAAFTWAVANNTIITSPAGHASFSKSISVTMANARASFGFIAAGRNITYLDYTGTGAAITVNYQSLLNASLFSDFTLTTSGAGTATGLVLSSSVSTLSNANIGTTVLQRLALQGSDGGLATNYFSTAIPITGVDAVNFTDVWIAGSNSFQGIGVSLSATNPAIFGASQYNFQTPTFQSLAKAIDIATSNVQGIYINQGNLSNASSIFVEAAVTTGCQGISLINSTSNGHNVLTLSGTCSDIYIAYNDLFTDSTGTALILTSNAGAIINGNTIVPVITAGTGTGISVGTSINSGGVFITNNQFYNLATGVTLASGTADAVIRDNNYVGTTTPITNNSTVGGNKIGSPAVFTFGSNAATLTAASTFFCAIVCNATEANVQMPITGHSVTGIYVDQLEVVQSGGAGGAVANTYTWRCNGTNSNITTTLTGATAYNADTTHNAIYTTAISGSLLCDIDAVIGAGAVAQTMQGSIRVGINP